MAELSQVIARVGSVFGLATTDQTRVAQAAIVRQSRFMVPWREQCGILRLYYQNNGLYQLLNQALVMSNAAIPGMMPLRNPANRIVEFYASSLWPGPVTTALDIVTDNEDIVGPIHRVWEWSNLQARKQILVRDLALYGEMYVKVASDPTKVYFQRVDPAYVTEVQTDSRNFITYLRLDIPMASDTADKVVMHTEVWDKAEDRMRVWVTETTQDSLPDLNTAPVTDLSMTNDLGIDFVPVAHAPFRDVGDDRGQSVLMPLLDKIDEANRQATRLAQIMFRYNRALWVATAGGLDKDGRPVPAPDVGLVEPAVVGDDTVISMPGAADLKSLVPDVNFDAYRNMLLDTMHEIQQDAPEMGFAQLFEKIGGDMSGRAIRFALAPAIARAEEARGNGWSALIRADQMAITLGQIMRLPDFQAAGTFEAGDLTHTFKENDIMPASRVEDQEFEKAKADAVFAKTQAGWSERAALEEAGYSPDEIEIMQQERASATLPLEQ